MVIMLKICKTFSDTEDKNQAYELLVELGTEDHMMEIQYWDESYDPVGAMFGYHNPVRLVKVESTKYFDMPDSNYGSES